MAACHGAALVSLITFLPVYLQVVRGASPSETGFLLVPLTIGIGTGSLVTGRLMNKTGLTTVFPIVGLSLVTAILVVLAFWASALGTSALAGLLLCNGLFMGTVMGVVQVSVQSAAGQLRARRSRRLGAIFALDRRRFRHRAGGDRVVRRTSPSGIRKPPASSRPWSSTRHAGPALPPDQRAAIQADIQEAFRAAFLTMAAFTTGGFFLALTNPLRRI